MSSFYTLEPQTTAKVLMHTTAGDLDLELWATQCPLTCRSFLQHCLDGYYDNTIFHRLVPGFILQGGDPTGTGYGGDSIYPEGVFQDEFHSRLKFNRRGLLGMANSGKKDDNGSQFFFTLAETKELNGKNTVFGKVVGETIYNLVKMGERELEKEGSERMLYPVRITGTEVLVNPFEEMVGRVVEKREEPREEKKEEKRKKGVGKKKGKKQLLSFGEEVEEGDVEMPVSKMKFDARLVKEVLEEKEEKEEEAENAKDKAKTGRDGEPVAKKARASAPATAAAQRKSRTKSPASDKSRSPSPPSTSKPPVKKSTTIPIPSRSPTPEPTPREADSFLAKTNAQIEALKTSLKRGHDRSETAAAVQQGQKKSLLEIQKAMLPATSVMGRKRKRKGGRGGEAEEADEDAMEALERFKRKLEKAKEISSNDDVTPSAGRDRTPGEEARMQEENQDVGAEEEEYQLCDLHFIPHCQSCKSWEAANQGGEDADVGGGDVKSEDFLGHILRFEKDRLGKDLKWKKDHEYDDGLVVIDPREREKEVLGKSKGKGGGGGREWDRDKGRRGVVGDRGRERGGGGSGGRGEGGRR
ncbi:cyclophilin-like domain-containing protein [Kalaharituber pfeilii]|nr:cyclophilin-like domain-containing protein [Kalaharituber pfeilii]